MANACAANASASGPVKSCARHLRSSTGWGRCRHLNALVTQLAATGETARRRDVSTTDELTPQELHIAQLLASGQTTREAAASLFLSPKTIEYHLRSIYRKLGVKSREELTRALRRP